METSSDLEFYTYVIVVAMIAVGLWEVFKRLHAARILRLQVQQDRATPEPALTRLAPDEMDDFRGLLSINQAERLLSLRTRHGATDGLRRRRHDATLRTAAPPSRPSTSAMPATPPRPTSSAPLPSPTTRFESMTPRPAMTTEGDGAASSSMMRMLRTSSRTSGSTMRSSRSVETQTDPTAFTLMTQTPTPIPQIQEVIPEGPYYQVPGRDHVHLVRNCWG